MGRATNCLRVLVSRVGIVVGGTLVRSSFGIQRPEVFACLCVVLGLTLETRVPVKQSRPIILQGDQIDQELSPIRLDQQSILSDVAANCSTCVFPLKAQGVIAQKSLYHVHTHIACFEATQCSANLSHIPPLHHL